MAIGYDLASIRTAMLALIVTRAGNGALFRGYNGTRPATGAGITTQTLLFELTCGTPFGTVTDDVLTITNPTPANASVTGSWTWWRVVKSDGTTFVMDGASSDFTLSGTETQAGQPVTLTGLTITEGNP
mgnify:CR=1 FL=1|tara:strand:- start:53 stop:439 length:387 start_codon:yes stop_codon:yes gene_type:complete